MPVSNPTEGPLGLADLTLEATPPGFAAGPVSGPAGLADASLDAAPTGWAGAATSEAYQADMGLLAADLIGLIVVQLGIAGLNLWALDLFTPFVVALDLADLCLESFDPPGFAAGDAAAPAGSADAALGAGPVDWAGDYAGPIAPADATLAAADLGRAAGGAGGGPLGLADLALEVAGSGALGTADLALDAAGLIAAAALPLAGPIGLADLALDAAAVFPPLVGFDPRYLIDGPIFYPMGAELMIAWRSPAPPGTWFQVYLDRRLAWFGQGRSCFVPTPPPGTRVDIGAVPAALAAQDLSGTLAPAPGSGDQAVVTWAGGPYLEPGVAIVAYEVYSSPGPGRPVDLTAAAGEVAPSSGPEVADGFGMGGFGAGGWGSTGARYSWTSPRLAAGTWQFAVAALDVLGRRGVVTTVTIVVLGPPGPPTDMRAAYSPTTRAASLTWTPPTA